MEKLEDKDLCKACGGMCCKKSGCDYYVTDFKTIDKGTILKALETGEISITSTFISNGNKLKPFLYLRARNKDRDIVDLFSMKKECSMLTSTGCSYDLEHRPSGGVNLIPKRNILGRFTCYQLNNQYREIIKWAPYQNLLGKIVKRYTGKSVNKVISEDVERVMFEVLTGKFDGISKREIEDIKSGLPTLISCYKEEFTAAKKKAITEKAKVYIKSPTKE